MAGGAASALGILNPLGGRRLVVIDPGTRFLKLLSVWAFGGRVRVQQQHTVNLEGEGVLAAEETSEHLESLFPDLYGLDRAVLVPQDRTICQTVEVPVEGADETRDYLLREARKLSGLDPSQLRLVYAPLRPFGRYRNPHWVTLCKREEVDSVAARFLVGGEVTGGLEQGGLCEVTTNAQALFAASRGLRSRPENAVLIELRSRMTVVAMLVNGQGCFATSLPDGFVSFVKAAAADGGVDATEALESLRNGSGFEAPGPALREAIDRWHLRVQTAVREWLEDNPELMLVLNRLPAYVCGSGAQGGGIVGAIPALAPLKLQAWDGKMPGTRGDVTSYWAAYGLALHALRRGPHRLSLLPDELNAAARRRRRWRLWQRFNVLLLLALIAALTFSLQTKRTLLEAKETRLTNAQTVLEAAREMVRLYSRLHRDYAALHPVLEREQFTMDVLQSLAALQREPTNRAHWYALFADSESYAAGSTLPRGMLGTNALPVDPAVAAREFVIEVCLPSEGAVQRSNLSEIVNRLREDSIFSKVDTLPPERHRDLVDPSVVISNHLFSMSLRMAGVAPHTPHALSVPVPIPLSAPAAPVAAREGRTIPAPVRVLTGPGTTNR
ncbi:MAG: hypothetical protein H7A46_20935 [Verrucomicrobiales bacterium]|nr:hypothetical protein [Verrucomicrobiales bacterium]